MDRVYGVTGLMYTGTSQDDCIAWVDRHVDESKDYILELLTLKRFRK